MRILSLLSIFFLIKLLPAQVGVHTDFPDASAAMEIQSTDKGLLIPRVTLSANLGNPSPVASPATGLMVFNSGPNQDIGFYYWDGSQWVAVGAGGTSSTDFWGLKGNSGTVAGTNFLGTTDAEDLAIFTNDLERMRIMENGQVVIGSTNPNYAQDHFTVIGNATQYSAINAYSPFAGVYSEGVNFGVTGLANASNGYGMYALNTHSSGYGLSAVGSNQNPVILVNHSAGITSSGNDGIFAYSMSAAGNGIIGVGSLGDTAFTSVEGSGGAFTGYHGTYSRARSTAGTGVIGGGNYGETYTLGGGSGGAFTGNVCGVAGWGTSTTSGYGGYFQGGHGSYAKAINTNGIGVIAIGNNGSGSLLAVGCGGTFTGYHGSYSRATNATGLGVIGVGSGLSSYSFMADGSGGTFMGYHGLLSKGNNSSLGTGVIGIGNNLAENNTLSTGSGGAFTGYHGAFGKGVNVAGGTGIIGFGNNLSSYNVYSGGSGGAFTGISAGAVGWGTDASTGTGVIGAGNNQTPFVVSTGSGGAFTGTVCGVYGYATNSSNDRYGGYFATAGSLYAYIGGRFSGTNRKVVGSGTVSTIVKSTTGELITMSCPEAPEIVFQDYGIGELVDGFARVTIDPNLAININVSESHPLKVFITPEGDCHGVYVTNKSANGFDVVELMGGKSNISFSWQIVATRANEEYTLKDGSVEISDNSTRFPPAPGPLESFSQAPVVGKVAAEANTGQPAATPKEFETYRGSSNPLIIEQQPALQRHGK